jgi:hypothetical protein
MILNKEVDIRIGNKEQMEYYSKLGYQPDWKKIITIKVNHLMLKSNVKLNVRCDVCRVEKTLIYSKYTKNTKNLTEDYCCSNKCAMTKQENSCLEKYGFNYPAQNKDVYGKVSKSCLDKYGVDHYSKTEEYKDRYKKTCLEKYGVDSSNSDERVKEKMRKTLFKNYGVYHPTQNGEIFSKSQRNSFKIHTYNNTNLTYQGSYERYFLEFMDDKGLLNDISNGKSYNYKFNNKVRVYHSDFLFNNITIEIKSSWTYNRNNKDELLQLKNETRWQTVRDLGDDIVILKSKEEIKNYVDNIVYNMKTNEL